MAHHFSTIPVNRIDPTGTSWKSFIKNIVDTIVEVAEKVVTAASKSSFAKAASVTKTTPYIAGGVYSASTNGLANSYTAMGNSLSTGAKVLKGVGVGLLVADCGISVYDNFTNNNLSTSRKISDSVVDVGVAVGGFWAAGVAGATIGTAIPIPVVGTLAGAGVGLAIGAVVEFTPVVGWAKDGVGAAVDGIGAAGKAVGNFFGGLFG